MAYEPKDLTGTIFPNKDKRGDNDPDGKGSLVIDGKKYWISAWRNRAKNGEPYTKLALKLDQPRDSRRSPMPQSDDGDSVPF